MAFRRLPSPVCSPASVPRSFVPFPQGSNCLATVVGTRSHRLAFRCDIRTLLCSSANVSGRVMALSSHQLPPTDNSWFSVQERPDGKRRLTESLQGSPPPNRPSYGTPSRVPLSRSDTQLLSHTCRKEKRRAVSLIVRRSPTVEQSNSQVASISAQASLAAPAAPSLSEQENLMMQELSDAAVAPRPDYDVYLETLKMSAASGDRLALELCHMLDPLE